MSKILRKSPIARSTKPIKRTRIRKHPRKPSETLRIYGPLARRKWMKLQPCSACGVVGYSEGAHVLGNGGMSRKADYDTQAPLCGYRMLSTSSETIGCHKLYDDYRWIFDEEFPGFDPEISAAETESRWLEAHPNESEND